MSAPQHLAPAVLAGRTIDCHSHAGVWLKAYACGEYPYAQSIEGLYYRQRAGGVDVNVVFPCSADLHFDLAALRRGEMVPARDPVSALPYAAENALLLREVFEICPEIASRFMPFVSADPVRAVAAQVESLRALAARYPVYGIKINPVGCQSPVSRLLHEGAALLDFAEARDLPLLFHVTTLRGEEYSQAVDAFAIAESRPGLRFCLAHCLQFDRELLRRADQAPNIWVDTAAIKIQVDLVRQEMGRGLRREKLWDADYCDHLAVFSALCEALPQTMIWGTDSPAYSFICRRKDGEGAHREFALRGTYEDEVRALDSLGAALRARVGSDNAREFIFGGA
jgi:predicted TIM-barrel fold metal-dependent hydrolase